MTNEGLTKWIERIWVSDTARWLGTLRTSEDANAKRTRGGWDPCRSDEEALWGQASEERGWHSGHGGIVVDAEENLNLEMVVVVRREGVRTGTWLYTVEGALWRAMPDVRLCQPRG